MNEISDLGNKIDKLDNEIKEMLDKRKKLELKLIEIENTNEDYSNKIR